MSAPTVRRSRRPQRDGRAHEGRDAHAWPHAHTCSTRSQVSEPLQHRRRHAEIPRSVQEQKGKSPGNFTPHSPVPARGTSRPASLCVPDPVAPSLTLPPTGTDANTRQGPTLCLVSHRRMCP